MQAALRAERPRDLHGVAAAAASGHLSLMTCVVCVCPLSLQLFTKPHPARTAAGKPSPGKDVALPGSLPSHPQPFFYNLQALKPSQVTVKGDYLVLLCLAPCPRVVPSVSVVPLEVQGHRPLRILGSDLRWLCL